MCTDDSVATENARLVYGEQANKWTEILNTITRYLEACEVEDTRQIDKSLKDDYEIRSEVSINESTKSLRSNR